MKLSYNDRQHAYWLDGKRCKGVTTVAKIPDDTFGLDKWRARQVVIGMASSPPLVNRAAAHFDERDKIDDIAEEAMVAAKAHEASGRGTAAHRITERVDLGLDWIDTPEARAIRAQWTAALDQAGLDIVPELVERIVVYPDHLVAGRFDRIARRRTDGRLVVVDVKTGENAVKYPHSTCVQLALYANAPLMAGPLVRSGQSETTDTFEPLPDGLDRTVGIIVYLPPEGPADIYELDLTAGWDTARTICFPTIAWRKTTGLVTKIAAAPPAVQAADGPTAGTPNPVQGVPADRATWIRDRVLAVKDAGHIADVAQDWPEGVPTLKQGGLTDQHIDQVAALLDKVEAAHGIPFGHTDPLFAGLATADQPTAAPARDTISDPNAGARAWTDKTRQILDEFDDNEAAAIRDLLVSHGTRTTRRHHDLVAALCAELADPNGAVILTYPQLGVVEITPTDAADRIVRATGTKVEAMHRAKRLAKELGRPNPRTFDHICADPALAPLVAAGLGTDNYIPTNQEQ